MSRIMVIRVGDNPDVDRIIAQLGSQDELIGIFASPLNPCDCPPKQREDVKNWTPAKKWGIPICKRCKRPSRYWLEGVMKRLRVALGNPDPDQVE